MHAWEWVSERENLFIDHVINYWTNNEVTHNIEYISIANNQCKKKSWNKRNSHWLLIIAEWFKGKNYFFFCMPGASRFIVSNTIFGHCFLRLSCFRLFLSLRSLTLLARSLVARRRCDVKCSHTIFFYIFLYLLYKHTVKAFFYEKNIFNSIFGNAVHYHKEPSLLSF